MTPEPAQPAESPEARVDAIRAALQDGTQIMTAGERVQWIERAKEALK